MKNYWILFTGFGLLWLVAGCAPKFDADEPQPANTAASADPEPAPVNENNTTSSEPDAAIPSSAIPGAIERKSRSRFPHPDQIPT